MRFTREQAISICERRLRDNNKLSFRYDCYYHDANCELGFECNRNCPNYTSDISFTNYLRYNILNNPKWVKENWERLCQTDKELFIAIHGGEILCLSL